MGAELRFKRNGRQLGIQKVNTNHIDNRGGNKTAIGKYVQKQQVKVSGGLTAKVPNPEDVKTLMMQKRFKNKAAPRF